MADWLPKETRSKIMSHIRSKNTKPEVIFRKALFTKGYRYSLRHKIKGLRNPPDITLVSRKACIFIDGCFGTNVQNALKNPLQIENIGFLS